MSDRTAMNLNKLDQIVTDFEDCWTADDDSLISKWLHKHSEVNQDKLLYELLLVDLELQASAGKPVDVADYVRRFPDHARAVTQAWNGYQADLQRIKEEQTYQPTAPVRLKETVVSGQFSKPPGDSLSTLPDEDAPRDFVVDQPIAGRYREKERLGVGGMGIVFRAWDEILKRDVAIKRITQGMMASKDTRRRFEREAEAISKLQHPNIVAIHEYHTSETSAYIAMQFVDGQNLSELYPKDQACPVTEAARILISVAEAIQHAHSRGVIHRDLKPQNILIERDTNNPWIVDFGLAGFLESDGSLTRVGATMGTPSYMAPEQIGPSHACIVLGNTTPLEESQSNDDRMAGQQLRDTRTDVYGLGAILYFLLTGLPPHQKRGQNGTLSAVLKDELVPVRNIEKDVPRDLAVICEKCLEKNPKARFGTAQEVADDLRRFQNDEPIKARPAPWLRRIAQWTRKNRGATAAAITLLVIACVSTVAAIEFNAIADREIAAKNELQQTVAKLQDETVGRTMAEAAGALATRDYLRFQTVTDSFEQLAGHKNPAQAELMKAILRVPDQPKLVELERMIDGNWDLSCADISPDGRWLVTLDGASLISIYDLQKMEFQHRLTRGFFIPEEKRLPDRIIPIGHFYHYSDLDAAAVLAKERSQLPNDSKHKSPLHNVEIVPPLEAERYTSVCWAVNPLRVIATLHDGRCVLFDPEQKVGERTKHLGTLFDGKQPLTTSDVSSDQQTVLVGDSAGQVTLLNVTSDAAQAQTAAVFQADGAITCVKTIAEQWLIGTETGQLSLLDSSLQLLDQTSTSAPIWSIAVRDQSIAVGMDQATVMLWDVSDKFTNVQTRRYRPAADLSEPISAFVCVEFHDERIWAFDNLGRVYTWDSDGKGERLGQVAKIIRLRQNEPPRSHRYRRIVYASSMNDRLLIADRVGNITTLKDRRPEIRSLYQKAAVQLGPNPQITFGADSADVLWAVDDTGTLSAIDSSGTLLAEVDAFPRIDRSGAKLGTNRFRFPSGTEVVTFKDGRVATVGRQKSVRLWKLKDGHIVSDSLELKAEFPLLSLAICESRQLAAAVDVRSRLNVWNLKTGRRTHVIPINPDDEGPAEPLTGRLAFNCTGDRLVAFGSGQASRLYNTSNWRPRSVSLSTAGDGGVDINWSTSDPDLLLIADTRHTRSIRTTNAQIQLNSSQVFGTEGVGAASKSLLVNITDRGSLTVWSPETGANLFRSHSDVTSITGIAAHDQFGVFLSTKDGGLYLPAFQQTSLLQGQSLTVPADVTDLVLESDGYLYVTPGNICTDQHGTSHMAIKVTDGDDRSTGELLLAQHSGDTWKKETVFSDSKRAVFRAVPVNTQGQSRMAIRAVTDAANYTGDTVLLTRTDAGWQEELIHAQANTGLSPVIYKDPLTQELLVFHHDAEARDLLVSRQANATESGWPFERLESKSGSDLKGIAFQNSLWLFTTKRRTSTVGAPQCWRWSDKKLERIPLPKDVSRIFQPKITPQGELMVMCHSYSGDTITFRTYRDGHWEISAELPEPVTHNAAYAVTESGQVVVPVASVGRVAVLIQTADTWKQLKIDYSLPNEELCIYDIHIVNHKRAIMTVGKRRRPLTWLKAVEFELPDDLD